MLGDVKMKTVFLVRSTSLYYDSRVTKEIRAFIDNGYRVIAVGWDREGDAIEKCSNLFPKDKVSFLFFSSKIKKRIGIFNFRTMFKWLRFVKKTYLNLRNEIDFVHGCNLDTCLFIYKRLKKDKKVFVHDIFDYYVDARKLPKPLHAIIEKEEIKVINSADLTIICTEERRQQISKAKPKKLIVVHNSPTMPILNKADVTMDYFYCGTLCDARLIKETLEEYQHHTDLRFGFAGFGVYQDLASKIANENDGFSYFGRIPYSECLALESKSMCLSAIYEPSWKNHQLCAPNKFYESLALGKPIIVCRGTGIDKIVEEHRIGIVINYSASELFDAIIWFKTHKEESAMMSSRARSLYEKEYDWRIMSNRLLTAYKSFETKND